MANSSLTWETKKTWDVGLDFRLWDRFYGTIDWYRSMTDDMLWNVPMSIEKGDVYKRQIIQLSAYLLLTLNN